VPWYQGIEFYFRLRRLGKEVWMFNFNGEKHNLTQRENQKYWTSTWTSSSTTCCWAGPGPPGWTSPCPTWSGGSGT